jgi:hypothetical protein
MENTCIQDNLQPEAATASQQSYNEQNIGFKSVLNVSAKNSDSTPLFINSYKSSDEVAVSVRIEIRRTSTDANKSLLKNIKQAVEVIERNPKFNDDGKQIGERALLSIKYENANDLQNAIIWTNGSKVYLIESHSLQHLLEFEKWFLDLAG